MGRGSISLRLEDKIMSVRCYYTNLKDEYHLNESGVDGKIETTFALTNMDVPIPVAVKFKAWVCDRSLTVNADSNPAGDMDICLLRVLCVVRQRFLLRADPLVRRGPTECGVSECDREASIMWRPWHTGDCCAMKRKKECGCERTHSEVQKPAAGSANTVITLCWIKTGEL